MSQAVCDSGPLTHLWQIETWSAFESFQQLWVTPQVIQEVTNHVDFDQLGNHVWVAEYAVGLDEIEDLRKQIASADTLQNTDWSILALSLQRQPEYVLTDDLALRREVERQSLLPMGSVGILLRAYRHRIITAQQLHNAIDRLFDGSTLYLSPHFKRYVRQQIDKTLSQLDE